MEVDKQLYEEIKEYCSLNGLKPREFTNSLLRKAFMEEKFGKTPPFFNQPARDIVPVKPMSMTEPKDAAESAAKEENTDKIPTESRHDVAKNEVKKQTIKKRKL